MYRKDLLKEIRKVEKKVSEQPDNDNLRLVLAEKLYESGKLSRVTGTLAPLFNRDTQPLAEALFLCAKVDFLLGHYASAETLLKNCIGLAGEDEQQRVGPLKYLMYLYYQTNHYAKGATLFDDMKKMDATVLETFKSQLEGVFMLGEMMNAFMLGTLNDMDWEEYDENRTDESTDIDVDMAPDVPYHIVWNGHARTVLPFLQTGKYELPVVEVEINGVPVQAFIDTGGDMFSVPKEMAASMGIKPVTTASGLYAGGVTGEISYALADSLKLGDAVIRNLPIAIELEDRCSIGTGILKQFLSTLDYPNNRLILRSKNRKGNRLLQKDLKGKKATELPFALMGTHYILAHGSLNERKGLTFLVDSGLEDTEQGAAFLAPAQTLAYADIPIPDTFPIDGTSGAGDTTFEIGWFPVETLGLGPTKRKNLCGLYGVFPEPLYRGLGILVDGLISHNYLRHYAWTLNFKKMTMILAR